MFTELKKITPEVRAAYEFYFPEAVRVPVEELAEYMALGNLRLFATYNEGGRFVAGSFVTVGMTRVAPITFQSFLFSVGSLTSDELERGHQQNVLVRLGNDYPGTRLLFEVQDPEERGVGDREWRSWYVAFVGALGATPLWNSHCVDETTRFQLWGYPVAGESPTASKEQVAEWIYIILRFCYGNTEGEATRLLSRDDLWTGSVAEFERKAAQIA